MAPLNLPAGTRTALTWAGLGVLAVVVAVLAVVALRLGSSAPGAGQERTERIDLTDVASEPAPSATPTPTSLPAKSPAGAALSAAADGVLWRATAAECTPGPTAASLPVFERAEDGVTWQVVTPDTAEVREVLWLQAIDASSAEAVVRVGPDCETRVMRTFVAGSFWQTYPASITGAVVVDPVASQIVTGDGALPLPCQAPVRAVTGTTAPTVVCDGQVGEWIDGAWALTPLSNVVAASGFADDETLATAREATADCDGVHLERWASDGAKVAERCVPAAGVQAVRAAAEHVWLWSESGVERLSWAQ